MDKQSTYHPSGTDKRLAEFISNFADSGDSIMHIVAKRSFSSGHHVEFLQIIFDQYLISSIFDSFNDLQRKEFEFLVAKYKLVRSEVYSIRL